MEQRDRHSRNPFPEVITEVIPRAELHEDEGKETEPEDAPRLGASSEHAA